MMPLSSRNIWGSAIFLGLCLAVYWFLFLPGHVPYSPHSDIVTQHLATKKILERSLSSGHGIPFWRNDQFCGYPAFSAPQSLYAHPLHFLFYFLKPENAMGPTLWLCFVFAGFALYLMGKALNLGVWPRFLMALCGAFGFKIICAAYAGWLSCIGALVLFPVLFASIVSYIRRPSANSAFYVAGAGILCLHSGHLQWFYYSVLFCVVFVLTGLLEEKQVRQSRLTYYGWLAFAAVIAIGASAYLWFPMAKEAHLISRTDASYADFVAGHANDFRHLITLFHPEISGTPITGTYVGDELWEEVAYFGLVPLLLCFWCLASGWKRPIVRVFGLSFFACLFLSADTWILRGLFEIVPGYSLFRCPSRILFLASFFGICLAGLGLEYLLTGLQNRGTNKVVTFLVALVLCFAVIAEGAYYAKKYIAMRPVNQVIPQTGYSEFLRNVSGPFRVAPVGRSTINYGWAAHMGLELITGYEPYNFKHLARYLFMTQFGSTKEPESVAWADFVALNRVDMLDILNVAYVVAPAGLDLPPDQFVLETWFVREPAFVFYSGMVRQTVHIYRNTGFMDRVFFVDSVVEAPDTASVLSLMQKSDLKTTAVVRGGHRRIQLDSWPDDQIELMDYGCGFIKAKIRCKYPRFIIISEVWHPGWRATLDDEKVRLFQADHALIGAYVPAGEHIMHLAFRPLSWPQALYTSLAFFLIWIVFGFVCRRRKYLK